MSTVRILASSLVVISFLLLTASPCRSQPPGVPQASNESTAWIRFFWSAPDSGSAVSHYTVYARYSDPEDEWRWALDTSVSSCIVNWPGDSFQIKVAGIDNQYRQGPFSEPSEFVLTPASLLTMLSKLQIISLGAGTEGSELRRE